MAVTSPAELAVGSSINANLPSHPLVGTCIQSKRGKWCGASYLVRRPDSREQWMAAGEFNRAVAAATPKDVNLAYPDARAGQIVLCTGRFLESLVVNQVAVDPVGCGRIIAVTQKRITALDPFFQQPFAIDDISGPARPEVWACHEAIASGDSKRIEAAAQQLYYDEQDEVFGLGQCPYPATTRPTQRTPSTGNAPIDKLERDLCDRPGRRGPDVGR